MLYTSTGLLGSSHHDTRGRNQFHDLLVAIPEAPNTLDCFASKKPTKPLGNAPNDARANPTCKPTQRSTHPTRQLGNLHDYDPINE